MVAISAPPTGRHEPIRSSVRSFIRTHAKRLVRVLSSVAIIGLTFGAIGTPSGAAEGAERQASARQGERTFAFGVDGLPRKGSFL